MSPIRDISRPPIHHYRAAIARTSAGEAFGKGAGVSMFSASVSARSLIVLTCTATAMLTAWIIAAAPAVGPDEGRVRIVVGQVRPMGDGTIRAWVRLDAHDKPTSVGVTFTEAALQNLPTTGGAGGAGACCGGHEYALALPAEA